MLKVMLKEKSSHLQRLEEFWEEGQGCGHKKEQLDVSTECFSARKKRYLLYFSLFITQATLSANTYQEPGNDWDSSINSELYQVPSKLLLEAVETCLQIIIAISNL